MNARDEPFGDPDRFDFDELFEQDYLRFYSGYLTEEQTLEDAQLLFQLLELRPRDRVLDVACGHGRIANEMAKLGLEVVGIDGSEVFLDAARAAATEAGLTVAYQHGDMRAMPFTAEFDKAFCWFTSFGYFNDDENRTVLDSVFRALRPGGRFLIETMNLHAELMGEDLHAVKRHGDDFMIDDKAYDPITGREFFDRTVASGAVRRSMKFSIRLFTFTELRDWLLQAGFENVHGYGGDGEPFEVASDRMILVADKGTR